MKFQEKWRYLLGGCPKRKACPTYSPLAKTCTYGPYQYCGKYRSEIESKKHLIPISSR